MEAKKFTEKIYGPYGDAWKIIKLLALAEDDNPKLGEVLNNYMKEVGAYKEKYEGNAFAQELYKLLLRADDTVMRMDRENEREQKTEEDK